MQRKDDGVRNLIGLLDPQLATIDLETARGRTKLAEHFVQRRRADIRSYIDEETAFPSDRETREEAYKLSPAYAALFEKVLSYAREQMTTETSGPRSRCCAPWPPPPVPRRRPCAPAPRTPKPSTSRRPTPSARKSKAAIVRIPVRTLIADA